MLFRSLWELRQYRQKDKAAPDTPVKVRDDCVDPLRYLGLVRPWGPGAPPTVHSDPEEADTARRWDKRLETLKATGQEDDGPRKPWMPRRMVPYA